MRVDSLTVYDLNILKMQVDILNCLGFGYLENDGGYLKLFRVWIF